MRIVSTSYINTLEYTDPLSWLERLRFHAVILEHLARQHHVDSIEQINYTGNFERNGVAYHFINFKKRKQIFPFRLHRYIKSLHPDVVLVHGLIFPLQLIQLRWMLGGQVKIIIQHHAEKPYKGWKRIVQKKADNYVSAYLFTSLEMGMEWVKQGMIVDEKKIVEAMEGSSTFGIMNKEKALMITKVEGKPAFLWAGRLNKNKDPITVVKGFLEFICIQPDARLYMVFQTEELLPEIKSLIQFNEKAMEAIQLIGKISQAEMEAWYSSVNFIISGSHYEGSGIAVCEAMSCGCIPILTDIASFRKMTGPGKCGLLYEPGNSKKLFSALMQASKLDLEREKKKVLAQFQNELSFEAIAKKINNVLTD